MTIKTTYLDHGATSFPKAPGVVEAMARFVERDCGNPGRGGHRLTVAASRAIEAARAEVASLLGGDPERTLFGPSATFWLNTVLSSWLTPGDRVVTSSLEHNAVMRPLRQLEHALGLDVVVARGSSDTGVPDPEEVSKLVSEGPTRMVVLCHASNVTGAVLPVAQISRAVSPVPVLVDGAQTAGSLPVDFDNLGVSAFTCSGHKGMMGPSGTGVLLLAGGVEVEPLVSGGTGSRSESEEMPTWLPDHLEAGTPNGPGIAGLGAACSWIKERTVDAIHDLEDRLVRRAAHGLQGIPAVRILGWEEEQPRTGILSIIVRGMDCGELASWLDRQRGLLLRAGLQCAPAAHRRLGTFPKGTLRAGFGPFSTENDADALISAVQEATTVGLR